LHNYQRALKWEFGTHKYYVDKCANCGKERYLSVNLEDNSIKT
jgi:hypothetical protein